MELSKVERQIEDLILDSFMASSDIIELVEMKKLDNENETAISLGNQDIITLNDKSMSNDQNQEPAQKTFVQYLKENLIKIFLTLCGPISTYGLYYTDLISDILFMVTLFTNCHTFYYISSLSIIILSYITTVVFLKLKFNMEFKHALCYPFSHSKNLLCHLKNCVFAIWKGDPHPDEPEESKVFGHHIVFLETMSESVPQLCLQLIILRQFGLSKDTFQALTQTTALYSSVISSCILFAKRRAFIVENQLIDFSSCALWKSILFWIVPLLAFFLSAYIIAFSDESLIFNVLSCGIFLHPIVIIPIGITIDFVLSLLRNGWNNCKTDKKCSFAYTMPLHFALICFAQIFLTFEWANYHEEHVLNTNFTLKTSFNNYLNFDQCCNRRPCVTKGKPDIDIGVLVTYFVSLISKLIDHTNLNTSPHILVLVFTTILMVFYFMTEQFIGNPIPLIEFIIGPSTNEQGLGNGQSERCNEEEKRLRKTKNLKKFRYVLQIICCFFVILYIIALVMSPKLFSQTLTSKLFTCEDGLWDSNPNEPLHCIECQCFLNGTIDESNVCEKSYVSNGSCHSQPGCKYGYNGHDCGNCDSNFFVASYDSHGRPKCQECQCNLKGTGGSNKCDGKNGKCNLVPGCKNNFIGEHCEICIDPIPCYKQESSCYPCSNKFLIIGGETNGGNELETEIIDLQSNSDVTSSFGVIPSQRGDAVGGLIGSTPIICGGFDGNYQESCFTYNQSHWTKTHTMTTKRRWATSIQLTSTTLWIVGGYDQGQRNNFYPEGDLFLFSALILGGVRPDSPRPLLRDGKLDSSEFVGLDSTVGKPGPKLPHPLYLSCAVKYSADKVYIIGGSNESFSILNKVLIFNPNNGFTHIEGPSLITKRGWHACALMSNGQQSKIVVAGGLVNGNDFGLSSVEILDPTTNKWISGPDLPYKLMGSAMATSPDGGGVILFGGDNPDKEGGAFEDTLLELRFGADKWTTIPQKLKQPRRKHVVIPT